MELTLRVEVLGPLRVSTPSGVLTFRDFRGVKPKQILQILTVERGHVVSKSKLADMLWGESLPRNYFATLETYVSVLRQSLEPGGRARESVVLTERGGYRLDSARVRVDLDEFDQLAGEAAGAEPAQALTVLRRALALVRGQVLEDEPHADWAQQVRELYQQRQVHILTDAGRLALLTGDATAALEMAKRAVAINPLAERAYQVLMTSAYSLWRQDEALAAYDRCRRLLADELGADPMDETVALHLSILRHEDIAEMLPVVEPPGQSPRQPTDLALIGREPELAMLTAAAERAGGGRLTVALVSGGLGLGKTRLAESFVESLGLPVGSNRCSDLERGFPFLALSLALRSVLPELSANGLPGLDDLLQRAEGSGSLDHFARLRVMETLASALQNERPFVLLLDDAQWADPDSITTIGYLQRRCRTAPLLVLLTANRSSPDSDPLRGLRPDVRVDLDVLPADAVARLAGADLYRATGGVPLFVVDWLTARARELQEEFTPQLHERVVTACWDLGPRCYRLLSTAAALDQQALSPHLLAALVGTSADEVAENLDRLLQSGMLVGVGDELEFRSQAVRSILRSTLSPARRRLLQEAAINFSADGAARPGADLPRQTHGTSARRAS